MIAKKVKVKKLIKEQRRAWQKAIREQERAATQKAKADAAGARAEWKAEEQRLRREQEAQQQPEKTRSAAPEDIPAEAEESAAPVAVPEQSEPLSHSRRQRRDQRKNERGQRGHNDDVAAPPASSASPAHETSTGSGASTASGSSAAKGTGARTGALVVTVGVVAAMVGSVVLDGLMDGRSAAATDQGATAALGAASVAAPQTGQSYICPPMPGQPDSLTTDGQLEYNDRDSSATSRFSAVLFATDLRGSYPESSWAQLNQESLINDITLTESEGSSAEGTEDAAEPAPLIEREAVFVSAENSARPPLLNTEASPDGGPVAAAGLYEYQAEAGPVTGLAIGECTAPERSQWFFGPEVAAGSSSLLTLANPYDRPATVEVTSVDSEGDRGTTGSRSVVVPGETTRSVNIAGIASAGTEMGVSVRSSGAPVTAQLQSSRAAGLTGTGVEFLPGMTEAGTSHLLPGVPVAEGIPDAEDQNADEQNSGDEESEEQDGQSEPTPPELWIHVPGDQGATVELQVYGENGQQSIDTPGVFTVDGGEVDVIDLQGLEAGISDIRVNTDVPAYVSVRSDAASGADFSWAAPTEPLAEGSGALLPEFGETELRLFATGSAGSIAYRVMDTEGEFGEEQSVELAADGAAVITAEDLASAEPQDGEAEPAVVVFADPQLSGAGSVHATMATTGGEDQVSLTAVSPLRGAEQYVPVRLLR